MALKFPEGNPLPWIAERLLLMAWTGYSKDDIDAMSEVERTMTWAVLDGILKAERWPGQVSATSKHSRKRR